VYALLQWRRVRLVSAQLTPFVFYTMKVTSPKSAANCLTKSQEVSNEIQVSGSNGYNETNKKYSPNSVFRKIGAFGNRTPCGLILA
jgi:hypothetical protein